MLADLLGPGSGGWPFSRYLCLGDVHLALRGAGSLPPRGSAQAIAVRLLEPTRENRIDDPRVTVPELVDRLARRMRWNLARHNRPDVKSLAEIREELTERLTGDRFETRSNDRSARPGAASRLFLPSKHLPLPLLRRQFPDFRIVWIVRDPRDALISYFHHDMGVLTEDKLPWFLRESSAGGWELRPDWRESYLLRRIHQQLEFYDASLDEWEELERSRATARATPAEPVTRRDGAVVRVRYEDLLRDCAGELERIAGLLRLDARELDVRSVVDRFAFERLTEDSGDTRDSFVRSGRARQWPAYFTRSDQEWMPGSYADLLQRLGYEASDDWIERLPESPIESLDLKRFRPRSSAVYQAMEEWLEDAELQQRFPRPFEFEAADSFFDYLRHEATASRIRRWFDRVDLLWDPERPLDRRHPADERLGY